MTQMKRICVKNTREQNMKKNEGQKRRKEGNGDNIINMIAKYFILLLFRLTVRGW
jgi:hypothetical protein